MRNGLRGLILMVFYLALPLAVAGAAHRDGRADPQVHLTVEINWTQAPKGLNPLELELSEGRISEAVSPEDTVTVEPLSQGRWRTSSQEQGTVRARLEAPLSAVLIVRAGSAATSFPLAEVIESPRRSVSPTSLDLRVGRVAWDALEVTLGESASEGIAEPGATVPVSVGFNILAPDAGDVALRYSAILRPLSGDEVLWRIDKALVLPCDVATPSAVNLGVVMPKTEGIYALEIEATWDSVAAAQGSRIGRLIRRRRSHGPTTVTRTVTLAVVGPKPPPETGEITETVVDTVDLSRVRRWSRPTASGRVPLDAEGRWAVPDEASVEGARGDILRGLIPRRASDLSTLAEGDDKGFAWLAVGLKTARPELPHRLRVTLPGGQDGSIGVALLVPGETDRLALDAALVTRNSATDGEPATTTYSWPVWPDSAEPVLVLVNRGTTPLKVGTIELAEGSGSLSPADLADGASGRRLGIAIERPGDLQRFASSEEPLRQAARLAEYLGHIGAGAVILPESLAERGRRQALDGQAEEDGIGPGRLAMLLRVLERRGVASLVEVRLDGPLPGLPDPGSAEALKRGLVRVDDSGKADGPEYHPLHPDVKRALERKILAAAELGGRRSGVSGVVVRLGRGPTLLGGPETGLDDVTFPAFIHATLDGAAARGVPGMSATDPKRFTARRSFVIGPGRKPWLAWRAKEIGALYHDLAASLKRARPGIVLAVVTPGLEDGPVGEEARLADQAGSSPLGAWRAVGLDLDAWPAAAGDGLIVLRGVDPSFDDLSHELATHPSLDAPLRRYSGRGMIVAGSSVRAGDSLTLEARPIPDGNAGDEPLGHALAVLDANWIFLAPSAVAGREDRIGKFARVFRALPVDENVAPSATKLESGVAARSWSAGGKSYVGLANDTPYTIRVDTTCSPVPPSAAVDDLGRGLRLAAEVAGNGQRFVLDLPPFGATAIRISAADATAQTVEPRVIDDHRSQYLSIAARLDQLARGSSLAGPPNPGFEQSGDSPVTLVAEIKPVRNEPLLPAGWSLADRGVGKIESDSVNPRSGSTSLRFDAKTAPASVTSDLFASPGGTTLTLRTWLRTDAADAKLRIWIEGEAAGKRVSRQVDVAPKLDWSEIAVRAAELPNGGLETVRLRFEALTPGRFWIDDVALTGQGVSESERRARRVLMTAVQAYREGRFADFARLASSRWARQTMPGLTMAPERPSAVRTGRASDLPAGRRLR